LRFVLDNDVAVTVRRVLLDAGHECWTAAEANLDEAPDDAQAGLGPQTGPRTRASMPKMSIPTPGMPVVKRNPAGHDQGRQLRI
jgi:hypothetical protein